MCARDGNECLNHGLEPIARGRILKDCAQYGNNGVVERYCIVCMDHCDPHGDTGSATQVTKVCGNLLASTWACHRFDLFRQCGGRGAREVQAHELRVLENFGRHVIELPVQVESFKPDLAHFEKRDRRALFGGLEARRGGTR